MCSHINVGSGKELTIKKLAETIKDVVKYEGQIDFDRTKPDGNHRKLIDSQRLQSLGWQPEVSLKDGLAKTYKDFLNIHENT